MANWADIENALVAWVKTASGYADGQVVWAEQAPMGQRPIGEILTLRLGEITPVVDLEEVTNETDLGRPLGREVELGVKGHKSFVVTLTAYGSSDGRTTGDAAGRAVLGRCQSALSLPSVRAVLAAVDVSIVDTGTITNVTTVDHARFESRATCDFRFYALEELSDFVGYIATAEVSSSY